MVKKKSRKTGSLLIIFGFLLPMVIFVLQSPPTYASNIASVEIWLTQEYTDGTPRRGETGNLYEQLHLTIESRGQTIFTGLMSELDEPLSITQLIGPVGTGEKVTLNLTAHLPGDTTGNSFQGSTLSTKYSILTRCTDNSGEVIQCNVSLEPEEALFDLRNLNPGDTYQAKLKVTFKTGELPVTGVMPMYIWILAGAVMIVMGIALKRLAI